MKVFPIFSMKNTEYHNMIDALAQSTYSDYDTGNLKRSIEIYSEESYQVMKVIIVERSDDVSPVAMFSQKCASSICEKSGAHLFEKTLQCTALVTQACSYCRNHENHLRQFCSFADLCFFFVNSYVLYIIPARSVIIQNHTTDICWTSKVINMSRRTFVAICVNTKSERKSNLVVPKVHKD